MGDKSVATPGTRSGCRAAWPLAILGLLILSCAPPPGSDSGPRTSGRPSYVSARNLEQLVELSTVITIGRLEGTEGEINLARDADNHSRASDEAYVLGQVYRLRVERYLKGEGADTIRVVQAEAWDYGGASRRAASSREAIQRLRQEALDAGYVIPLAPGITYLLFLRPLGLIREDDYYAGTPQPWRFVLTEDGRAFPDSPWEPADEVFPPRPAEELLGEIEQLVEGTPTATPSVHFITFASPEEIEEEMRLTPTVPGEIRLRTYMTAEALGELTVVNGCLYIQAIDAPNRQLLIWPPELYALDEREGTVRILDARSGEELVWVGDRIRVGGGQLAYEHLSDRVRAQLPTDCPGPYWAVGLGLERWDAPVETDDSEGSLGLEGDGNALLAFFADEPELQGAFGGIYLEGVAAGADRTAGGTLVLQLVRGHERVDEVVARLPSLQHLERLRIVYVAFSNEELEAQYGAISRAASRYSQIRAVSMNHKDNRVDVLIAPSDVRRAPDGVVDKGSLPAELADLLAHPCVVVREGTVHEDLPIPHELEVERDAAATPEAREIKATILEAYRLYDVADRTLDVSGLDDVLINEPSVPLTEEQADRIRTWFGQVSQEEAGYLTYVQGCYVTRRDAEQLLERALANARAANRDYLLPSDYVAAEELAAAGPGRPIPTPPPVRPQPRRSIEENVQWREAHFRFLEFHIDGDRATVLYEDVVTLSEATLVRREGRWYLAGVRRIRNIV